MEKILKGDKTSQMRPVKPERPQAPKVDNTRDFYNPRNKYYKQLDEVKSKVLFEEAIKVQDEDAVPK